MKTLQTLQNVVKLETERLEMIDKGQGRHDWKDDWMVQRQRLTALEDAVNLLENEHNVLISVCEDFKYEL